MAPPPSTSVFYVPHNLFVLALAGLDHQTLVVHLMDVSCSLHVAQYVILQLGYRLEGVGCVLILLNVTDNLSSLGSLGEVDEVSLLDDRWDTVLDEGKIRQVDTW